MWKKIKTSTYFLSYSNEYEIYITDYVTIWYAYFCTSRFLRNLKDSNSLLEMSDEALVQKGLQILSNPEDLNSFNVHLESDIMTVTMIKLFGYPFKLHLELRKGSNEQFYCILTQPLLKTILELKNSQLELCQLLKKKDGEIEEYKCEGGEIALKHLKTKPFNEEAVLSKYLSFQEHFGSTIHLIHDLLQTDIKVPEKNIKKEPSGNTVSSTLERTKVKLEHEPCTSSLHTTSNILTAPVKAEPDSQNVSIKLEPNSQTVTTKAEADSQISSSQGVSSINGSVNIKSESEVFVKREAQSIPMIRKKIKKLF